MTKRKPKEDDPEQSERFRESVRELEAAGELSPTEAEGMLDRLIRLAGNRRSEER